MSDEIRRQVLDSIADGRIPTGGPSDAAAHDLLADLPPGYWKRWSADTAKRIHAQPARCCCDPTGWPAEIEPDGRCQRCYGTTTATSSNAS